MISHRLLIGISIAALLGVFLLVRHMHRQSLRVQFVLLAVLGVAIGFIFLVMVQMRSFPMSFWRFASIHMSPFSVCLGRAFFCTAWRWKIRKSRTTLARNCGAILRIRDWRMSTPRDITHESHPHTSGNRRQ